MTSFSPNGSPAGIWISPPTLDLCVGLLGFRMDVGVELLLVVVPTKDKMFCKSTRAARSCTFLTLPRRPALASNFWTTSERSHGNLPSPKNQCGGECCRWLLGWGCSSPYRHPLISAKVLNKANSKCLEASGLAWLFLPCWSCQLRRVFEIGFLMLVSSKTDAV